MADFYTILTDYGQQALADVLISGKRVLITHFGVGDGDGSYYEPTKEQTQLRNEIWRGNLNDLRSDSDETGNIVAEAIIPVEAAPTGGWYIREVGLYEQSGRLFAVGKFPSTFQPDLVSGSGKQIYIKMVVDVGNVDAVQLIIDHSIVIASKEYVTEYATKERKEIYNDFANGAVNGVTLECATVRDAQNIQGLTQGKKIITYAHNVECVAYWLYSKTKPSGFYVDAIDGYLSLIGPATFSAAGIIPGAYNVNNAWHNRNTIQSLMRDQRFSSFSFGIPGEYHVLGSIHPLRDNITLYIESNVRVMGHYNDPTIPASLRSQSGGMFAFVHYNDPDNGDMTVTNTMRNITVVLDGDASTIFSNTHAVLHNNNVFGFYKVENTIVRGEGGISGSDHKGVVFDGDAVNCHIHIDYIKGTSNEALTMKGSMAQNGYVNSIKINDISALLFNGGNPTRAIFISDNPYCDIQIGRYMWKGDVNAHLVYCASGGVLKMTGGIFTGLESIARIASAKHTIMDDISFNSCDHVLTRASLAADTINSISLRNIKNLSGRTYSAYYSERSVDGFNTLEIIDCDFFNATAEFLYYKNKLSSGVPKRIIIRNNLSPDGYNAAYINQLSNSSGNLISGFTTTYAYNIKVPDFNYRYLACAVRNQTTGDIYQIIIDLFLILSASAPFTFNFADRTMTTSRTGNVVTMTAPTGYAFFYIEATN